MIKIVNWSAKRPEFSDKLILFNPFTTEARF